MKIQDQRIRVGIRGISGLLGSRLALAIARQPDMQVTVGIARNDPTLERVIKLEHLLRERGRTLATTLCLDEPHAVVRALNATRAPLAFEPADQFALHRHCDVIVDATSPGVSKKYDEVYRASTIPVILQSGEFPRGTLIAPPLFEAMNGNIWRQGDCCLSGLVPVLSLFKEHAAAIDIHLLMQYSEPLHDFPTDQRIQATYRRDDLSGQLARELPLLMNNTTCRVHVLQVPALDYYTASIDITLGQTISGAHVLQMIHSAPRIYLADQSISSTYEIDHHLREPLRAIGADLAPIVVYGASLQPTVEERSNHVRFDVAFYSRLIAILPNIDAIRILSRGTTPRDAMKETDRNMLINNTVEYQKGAP